MSQVSTVKAETSKIEVNPKPIAKKANMSTTKISISNKRTFETSLMGKEEAFKLLSLAEALKVGVLLIGPPGTGKTKIVTDYTKGMFDLTDKEHIRHFNNEGVFILETDEGTKPSEIKGMVDVEKLTTESKYEINSPITKADTIIINEVDKASSQLRNSLLGIMNERVLFNGKNKVKCNWRLFVATCNEIPKDEEDSPFWDRFALKMNVGRLSTGDMLKYYAGGDKTYSAKVRINVPTEDEINAVVVPHEKLERFLKVAYKECSDRTLSFVPMMTKAASLVYNCSVDKALIKTCELLVNTSAAQELAKELLSPEKRQVINKLDMIVSMTSESQIENAIQEVEKLVNEYASRGVFNQADINELKTLVESVMSNHEYYKVEVSAGDLEDLDDSDF